MDCNLQGPLSTEFSRQEYWSWYSLLQEILPTQGSNRGLLHCRKILYCLSYQGSLTFIKLFFKPWTCFFPPTFTKLLFLVSSQLLGHFLRSLLLWLDLMKSFHFSHPHHWNSVLIYCFCTTYSCCKVASVMSDSVRPQRRQPTRLLCPWDSPGKNTGVGCHFLLQCIKVKSESEVAELCPTLSDPMGWSLPGSSVHRIFQARVLECLPLPSPTTYSYLQ